MYDEIRGSGAEWKSFTRVLLTGEHPLILTALAHLIGGDEVEIVGECANHPETLRRAVGKGVDLVITDLDLDATRLERMERLRQLLAAAEGSPLLILTRSGDPKAIATALDCGAAGVVLKSSGAEVLRKAMRAVLAGGAWLDRATVASMVRPPAPARRPHVDADRLTRREHQIVELVTLGLQNKIIAERLSITETTVRHHLTSIFDKLAVANRMELMRYAIAAERRAGEAT